jgi:protein-S-isoprenylcysteine O-methyltransferase Ste14
MFEFIFFLIASIGIVYVSRASLRAPRSHGFYRFFAWETILALFLFNIRSWFVAPLSWYQLVSWFLLIVSIITLVLGVQALTSRGKPAAHRDAEPQLLSFEKTTSLVTSGIYRYIRHPLYSSLFFLTWGICFKAIIWLNLGMAVVATLFLIATARADEAECIHFFGTPYQDYMKRSKRFVPFIF